MYWRLTRSEFEKGKGEGNKKLFKRLVNSGKAPGLIAYFEGAPVGWCAVAPRNEYPVLQRSRILKPVDEEKVWSVVCFYVRKDHRKKGLTSQLLNAAARYTKDQGASILEGYPIDPKSDYPDTFAFTGLAGAFRKSGFKEVIRRSDTRPIMRLRLK
jgi:GNAT superfamily N-acetyltransferase